MRWSVGIRKQFRSSPDQYLFAYYYGVCRTETDQLNEETRDLLMKASQENVPEDVFFYLAKNEHALSNFHNALAHYNHFASLVNKKTQGQYGLDTLIVQSQNQVNPFRALQVVVQLEPDTIVESLSKPVVIEIPEKLADTIIEFRITPQVAYRHISQFKTEDAQLAFVDAWLKEQRLDSLYKAVAQARENYLKIDDFSVQQEAAALILQLETEWLALKPMVDRQYLKSREGELEYWEKAADHSYFARLKAENDSIMQQWEVKSTPVSIPEEQIPVVDFPADTLLAVEAAGDTIRVESIVPELVVDKVVYKIQIGTYKGKLPANVDQLFKRLSILRKIDVAANEKGFDVYTIGELTNFNDAIALQKQIRLEGVKDAFVVAYHNEKRITLEEAKKLLGHDR